MLPAALLFLSGRTSMAWPTASYVVAGLSTWTLLVGAANAQARSPGDLDPQGRVFTKIKVTMAAPGDYGSPVSGLLFYVVPEGGQRILVRTDDAGIATAWLRPSTYRLVTPQPVVWKGEAYSWDVLVTIRAGVGEIKLSAGNATAVVPTGRAIAVATTDQRVRPPAPTERRAEQSFKDSGRRGLWFNGGVAYGSLTCGKCDGYFNAPSPTLSVGATLTPNVRLGIGATVWNKSESGVAVRVAEVDARVRYYPIPKRSVFLAAGIGFGDIRTEKVGIESASEAGFAASLGVGMDRRLTDDFSVTPFWNGIFIKTSNADARVGQLGLGFTIH